MTDAREIPFTQYLLPDGRRKQTGIERPAAVAAKAEELIKRGFRFECEVLTTGHVSLTVADPDEEIDIAIEVVCNGPEVPLAVDRLVEQAIAALGSVEPSP